MNTRITMFVLCLIFLFFFPFNWTQTNIKREWLVFKEHLCVCVSVCVCVCVCVCSSALKCSILFMHLFRRRDKFHSSTDQKFCLPPLYLSHLGTLVTLGIYSAALFILASARLKGKQTHSAAAPKLLADSLFLQI